MRSKICNSGTKILNKNYYTVEHPIVGYERVFDSYKSFYVVATCEVSSARIFSAIAMSFPSRAASFSSTVTWLDHVEKIKIQIFWSGKKSDQLAKPMMTCMSVRVVVRSATDCWLTNSVLWSMKVLQLESNIADLCGRQLPWNAGEVGECSI